MKKVISMLLVFSVLFALGGCSFEGLPQESVQPTTEAAPTKDSQPVTEPAAPVETTQQATEPAPAEVTTVPPTAPEHSEFYIAGLSVEDVILYFNEVCLDAEYVNSGDPSLLQRWEEPLLYMINGEPTQEDLAAFEGFVAWLNTIEGFPGIHPTENLWENNLEIYFCTQQDMINRLGNNFYGMDGGVTFWYRDNRIYNAIICYRTDILQVVRNSVILEEIYNGLGPIQDTDLRPDSIIFSGYSEPQELTEIDRLILRLLYHPDMRCGMNKSECEAVIRQLYY